MARQGIDLGQGSKVEWESDGALVVFVDTRNTQETDAPVWKVSHVFPPEAVEALRLALEG